MGDQLASGGLENGWRVSERKLQLFKLHESNVIAGAVQGGWRSCPANPPPPPEKLPPPEPQSLHTRLRTPVNRRVVWPWNSSRQQSHLVGWMAVFPPFPARVNFRGLDAFPKARQHSPRHHTHPISCRMKSGRGTCVLLSSTQCGYALYLASLMTETSFATVLSNRPDLGERSPKSGSFVKLAHRARPHWEPSENLLETSGKPLGKIWESAGNPLGILWGTGGGGAQAASTPAGAFEGQQQGYNSSFSSCGPSLFESGAAGTQRSRHREKQPQRGMTLDGSELLQFLSVLAPARARLFLSCRC